MKLRSIELALPDAAAAAAFMSGTWGLAPAEQRGSTHYLRGTGPFPYLIALEEAAECFVRSTTFVCAAERLAELAAAITARGLTARPVVSSDPGEGHGLIVELPEGVILRFLTGSGEVAPITDRDMPVQLTHCVFNAADAEMMGHAVEDILGFRVSDRTKAMVFVRCNTSHHSTAFARAGFTSLNHVAFEMDDLDAVMRGIGRLRDTGMTPAWGPGRHGPGDNVYAYFIAPFGAVIEFSTAVEKVADDYQAGSPEDWTWPPNRIDQWGLSDKDNAALRVAEEKFRFRRDWEAAPLEAINEGIA